MNGIPKVSIVTVCFNAQKTIKNVLESVLDQTYSSFEYIIKDGGSSDHTQEIVDAYIPRFAERGINVIYRSEKDAGIYDAMNRAVELCSGTWINFMNADDKFYDCNVLQNIFCEHDYPDSHVLYGDTLEVEYGEYYFYCKQLDLIEKRMPFNHQSTFARRDVLQRFPFDLEFPIAADYGFLLDVYQAGLHFTDLNLTVSIIEKEGVSSVNLFTSFWEAENLRRKHGIFNLSEKALKKKLFIMRIKQFGMDYFPNWLKYFIRRVQRLVRKQKRVK